MADNEERYKFEISLSILDHLGRKLYRNFITIIGEAISNSWDANAENVWITIDRDNDNLVIKDDGDGMDADDFQHKFLKVGYSKRVGGDMKSPQKNRPYIGAKGIGKLALLSCSERICIISKKADSEDYVGGTIDNSGLDIAIKEQVTSDEYELESVDIDSLHPYLENHDKGTIIYFEKLKDGIRSTIDHLKKLIALYFRFSLIDEEFKIYVNGELVTLEDIKDLSDSTEFFWNINETHDPFFDTLTKLKSEPNTISSDLGVSGFVASVEKPSMLKIAGTDERVGIDLFVNGRLRERNILRHLPDFSTRHVSSYLYGQVHYDELDQDGNDRFTSSREGLVEGDEKFQTLIEKLKDDILPEISDKWDDLRLGRDEEGDDDNPRKSLKERRARSLYNIAAKDYTEPENDQVAGWIKELQPDAEFNIPSYVECFLSENLLRKKIEEGKLGPASCLNPDPSGNTCEDRYDPKTGATSLCGYCKGERGKQSLQKQKSDAGTAIRIRCAEEDLLAYLDYVDLAKILDNEILKDEDKAYKPLRNSVMHTARLTKEAQTKLTSVFDNITATVKQLMKKT